MPKQFRNVKQPPEELVATKFVVGRPQGTKVPPDGLVLVTDDGAKSYECQPLVWKDEGAFRAKNKPGQADDTAPVQATEEATD